MVTREDVQVGCVGFNSSGTLLASGGLDGGNQGQHIIGVGQCKVFYINAIPACRRGENMGCLQRRMLEGAGWADRGHRVAAVASQRRPAAGGLRGFHSLAVECKYRRLHAGMGQRMTALLALTYPRQSWPPQVLTGHSGPVRCGCFLPNGKGIMTGGGDADHSLRFWNPKTGECTITVQDDHSFHAAGLTTIAAHPDSTTIITGSEDGVACLVNVGNGRVLGRLAGKFQPDCNVLSSFMC